MNLVAEQVDRLLALADDEVTSGRLPSYQLAVAREGEVLLRRTRGAADDARYTVYSVTKALTAAVAWLHLTPETRVVEVLPALTNLDGVTVEHLLTHTAGFPRATLSFEDAADPARREARMRTWHLGWVPGEQLEYHPTSAHWVVAAMVEAVTGKPFGEVVRERVVDPLGLDALRLGPGADQAPVLDVEHVGEGTGRPDPLKADEAWLLRHNDADVRALGVPGTGAVSTADDVALLYQHLLHDPKGLWDPAALADATGHVRTGALLDPWTGVPALRTLGLTVAGDDGRSGMRQLGRAVGPRAFGASGLGGQIAWADPDSGLSFCFLTNGLERDQVAAFARADRLSTYAARCA